MIDEDSNKQWHQYFYYVLQELLTPVGLTVQPESPLGTYPPKIDVIIALPNEKIRPKFIGAE